MKRHGNHPRARKNFWSKVVGTRALNDINDILLAALFILLWGCASRGDRPPGGPFGEFCESFLREFSNVNWEEAVSTRQIVSQDALMVCASSELRLRSSQRVSPVLVWTKDGDWFYATIPANTVVVIDPPTGGSAAVEILEVRGHALLSRDGGLVRQHKIAAVEGRGDVRGTLGEIRRFYSRLATIGWEPLKEDQMLGPWDMIWTHEGGRVELEVIKEGRKRSFDPFTDVRNSLGQLTNRKRLTSDMYFVVDPDWFESVQARRVLGPVFFATDRMRVQQFHRMYGSHIAWFGDMDASVRKRWQETLTGRDLE